MRKRNHFHRIPIYSFICLILMPLFLHFQEPREGRNASAMVFREETMESTSQVYTCGFPVGIYLNTCGVMVIQSAEILTDTGEIKRPCQDSLLPGDYIQRVNGCEIQKKEQLTAMIDNSHGQPLLLQVLRDTKLLDISIQPMRDVLGRYRLGILVRDDVQGIGTLTYVTKDGRFGALGHPIHDNDTGKSVLIRTGGLYQSQIHSVMKGIHGTPGSLSGMICYDPSTFLGNIYQNCSTGIYGNISKKLQEEIVQQPLLSVAAKQQVVCGPAKIRCTIQAETAEYEVLIIQTDTTGEDSGFMLQVTDPNLLRLSGGIIQGMSGSPVIQNEKLVGAVTHVLVNDPTRGYGIFIEEMLEN